MIHRPSFFSHSFGFDGPMTTKKLVVIKIILRKDNSFSPQSSLAQMESHDTKGGSGGVL